MRLGVQFYSEIIVFSTLNFEITGTIDTKLHSAHFSYRY